jgi:hypothetical protein
MTQNKIHAYSDETLTSLGLNKPELICGICDYPMEYSVICHVCCKSLCNSCVHDTKHARETSDTHVNEYSVNGNHLIEPKLSKVICAENHYIGCKWKG